MKAEDLLDSMEYVDKELVEASEFSYSATKHYGVWIRRIAACLAIIIGLGSAFPKIRFLLPLPWYVEDIMTGGGELAGEPNCYGKVTVSPGNDLSLMPIPEEKALPIYYRNPSIPKADDSKLEAWAAPIKERLYQSLTTWPESGSYEIRIAQANNKRCNYLYLGRSYESESCGKYLILLDGECVTIDSTQGDEQILLSLNSIKEKLFRIFDMELPNAKVIRRMDSSGYGTNDLEVRYYDETAHPLNPYLLVSNCIIIAFDFENLYGEQDSSGLQMNASIMCYQTRKDPNYFYQELRDVRMLTLQEAERMLEKGYVYYPECEACQSMNPPVDFSTYDHVGFEYRQDAEKGSNLILPFYAFYKKINEAPDGTITYAKTYVCAIKILGMEAYFGILEWFHGN
jgi:hypothetical protein